METALITFVTWALEQDSASYLVTLFFGYLWWRSERDAKLATATRIAEMKEDTARLYEAIAVLRDLRLGLTQGGR